MKLRRSLQVVLTALALWAGSPLFAHKLSDSYLSLKIESAQITGQWDIALRDLELAVGLDANEDGVITWGELRAQHDALAAYARERLRFQCGESNGTLRVTEHLVDRHTDGTYAVIRFVVDGLQVERALEMSYRALFDLDPQHRGLLKLEANGQVQTAVFGPERATQRFELSEARRGRQFLAFAGEGVWHIWIGFDHILFLLALLLPAVLARNGAAWSALPAFRPAFINVLKIVTAFTVAHSITLSLATLGIVKLPSRWVESAIAASVMLAACNNLLPFFQGRAWLVAFLFGLIHGFGFANVLLDLGLAGKGLVLALVGFNLGVEAGQLAIVGVFLPIAFVLRGSWFYQRLTLQLGSVAIVLMAGTWMCERVFDFKWLPF
ncbi:MAG: HupE/UreJ family protein [Verrucomicrobia bacterium]|nr:HupE/UreJ family protein [Verrucomicrobiota bacterium]